MDQPFLMKWLLSLIIGGSWVTVTTVIAERLGPKLGGLIGGMPSTALVSFLFIALTQSTQVAVTATTIVPASVGFYCFFFLSYLQITKFGFYKALALSLIIWFIFAVFAITIDIQDIWASVLIWLIFVTSSVWFVLTKIKLKPVNTIKISYTPTIILGRAMLAGIIISTAVFMAKLAGPVWGGVLSTFPALTISTLLIVRKTAGLEFTRHIMKNIFISITINLGIFALLVRLSYPRYGPLGVTIFSYIGTLGFTYILYKILKK